MAGTGPTGPTTARDIITLALKEAGVLGVGQTPLAEDTNDSFTYLGRMIAQWQQSRWMVPALYDVFRTANGQKSYTVGPGADFDINARPRQIKQAYFIQLNTGQTPVSLPLSPVFSYEDYARITVKNLATLPDIFFYDNNWPNGNLFFWPIPNSQFELHVIVQRDLGFPIAGNAANQGLDSIFTLPDEYLEAVHYNLALRLCSGYQIPPQASTVTFAKLSLNRIKSINTQVAELQMPIVLRHGKAFNIFNPDGY